MNTRTMKRSAYMAHEENRKAALRKRCIYRCRMAVVKSVTQIAAFICAIAFIAAGTTHAIAEFSDKSLIEEAKTPAIERMATTTTMDSIVENTDNNILEEEPIKLSLMSVKYSDQSIFDELDEMTEEEVSTINEQEEEVEEITPVTTTNANDNIEEVPESVEETSKPVEEDTDSADTSTGSYDPSQPISLTNRYKHPTYQYTQEDYEYLLMTIVGEAQNCSYEHQMYVGSVVLNRLHNDKYFSYADCIKDVVLAKSQYTCFNNGMAYRTPTDLNIQVAHDLIDNGSALPGNVIFQAEFTQGEGIYAHIGNTYFCYKN